MDSNKTKQNDDLGTCRVKFSINLETLRPDMKNATGYDSRTKFEKEFDFFVPEIYRPPNNSTIFEPNPQLSTIRDDLEDWISDSYGTFVPQKYGEKLANHAASCIPRLFPSYPVEGTEFQILCYFFIIGFILDDYFLDNTGHGDDEGAKKENYFEMGSNTVAELFETTAGSEVIDTKNLTSKAMDMKIFKEHPFLVSIGNSMKEIFIILQTVNGNLTLDKLWSGYKLNLLKTMESARWTFRNENLGKLDAFSEDTCRYFRTNATGFTDTMCYIRMLEGIELPQIISGHPVFIRWHDIGENLAGILNNLLGLQKDLLLGEEEAILLYKLRNGTLLSVAVDEELQLLRNYVNDYTQLRRHVLTEFGEKYGRISNYVELVDNFLHGSIYAFRDSVKYGMTEQIWVNYED
ncbi:uncharacterized protein LOC118433221 [Folsomia candida]|uniref:uncharacterized protein LOC118433221 n=1 Tax=Folsomia candida TaxID=158441 RepID=UPI001604B501|nr:uncharacterized protein LOC118433221 [Folsomia candida]